MAGAGRVLIIERLVPQDGGDAVPALLSDINMLMLSGGRERTNAEYGELLTAAVVWTACHGLVVGAEIARLSRIVELNVTRSRSGFIEQPVRLALTAVLSASDCHWLPSSE